MASPFSISTLLGVGILTAIMLLLALPMIQTAFSPPATTATNGVASHLVCIPDNSSYQNNVQCLLTQYYGQNLSLSNNSYYGKVFSLTNTISFGSPTNSSSNGGGFNANLFISSVLAFVFPGIGQIIQVVATLGNIVGNLFGSLFIFLPNPMAVAVTNIIKLLIAYVALRMMFSGIGAWMKFSLWDA